MKKTIFIPLFLLLVFACTETKTNNPLNIKKNQISNLIGNEVPFEKWNEWGSPETLEGTDNERWVIYLGKSNLSMVSEKKTRKVLFAGLGKDAAINWNKKN